MRHIAVRSTRQAEEMLRNALKWRHENKIFGIRAEEVGTQVLAGRAFTDLHRVPPLIGADMYTHGFDREGRPVCVLRMHTEHGARSFLDAFTYRLPHPDPHSNEQKLRFMIYSMERAIRFVSLSVLPLLTLFDRLMGPNVEKMVWLVNCTGYNMKHNGEMSFARLLLQTLQDYYPERYGKCCCAFATHFAQTRMSCDL